MEVLPDMGPTIKANAASHMEAAIAALSGELSKLRTGRASPGTLPISHLPNFHSLENFHHILIFFAHLSTMFVYAGMLDHIIVETSGLKLPLNQIAVVSVMDSKTLSINPFDPNVMKLFFFV